MRGIAPRSDIRKKMIRFADPQYLWLLLLLIPVALIFIVDFLRWRKKVSRIGDAPLVKSMISGYSFRRDVVKRILLLAALALLVVIIARPQMGTRISNEKRNGIEVVVAIDVSNSMLATDVAPSRLDKTKLLVSNMIDRFSNDKLGIVVFAGDAFVQLPITNDFVSAKMFLQSISPSLISTQGTDIARAITLSAASFTQAEGIGKAIIIVTDGEDHEGGANEAARKASDKGLNVVVMGVGSTKGAPIKMPDGDYLHDSSGNVVMTALNEQMCQEVATAGKGLYIHVDNTSSAQDELDDFLARLQKGETENTIYSEYAEQTPWIALVILLLLVFEALLVRKSGVIFGKIKTAVSRLIKPRTPAILLLLIALSLSSAVDAQTKDRMHIKRGNTHFRGGNYDKSLVEYQKAIDANSQNAQALYNYGCALLMQNQDSAAIEYFQEASRIEKNKFRRSKSFHNIGFICQRHQMFGEAIEAYKESLRLNPTDNETRYNLALCQRNQQKQGGGQSENNNDNEGKDKDKNTDKDKNADSDKQNKSQQQKSAMSKDNVERLLNAVMQQEKETQKKMKNAQQQGSRHLDKNW